MGRAISGEGAWRRSRIVVGVPQPAAGADWSVPVPAGHLWNVLSILATLTTSAVVATRIPRLIFGDGVATFLDVPPFAGEAASLTRRYVWVPAGQGYTTGNGILSPLPEVPLGTGWTLATTTDAIDVADQWSAIKLAVVDTTIRDGAIDIDTLPDLVVSIVEAGPRA